MGNLGRRFALGAAALAIVGAAVAGLAPPAVSGTLLLRVADGGKFYTKQPKACTADTDVPAGATARRSWAAGKPALPFLFPEESEPEPTGGSGCLGGPKVFGPVTVLGLARVKGTIRYASDPTQPGACCSDVHLHVREPIFRGLVTSTFFFDGPQPVLAGAAPVREHAFDFALAAGTYYFYEDVFSGTHTMWLTNFTVVDSI